MSIVAFYKKHEFNVRRGLMGSVGVVAGLVGHARADLAGDLSNLTVVSTSVTAQATTIMQLFMQPPLVIFVGITVFAIVVKIVARLMHQKK